MVTMFQPWTAKLVRERKKFQTIRPIGQREIKVGEKISLREWSGLPYRSKQISIYDGVITDVIFLVIFPFGIGKGEELEHFNSIYKTSDDFAVADGFIDFLDMSIWFDEQYGLPFHGRLIRWREEV
jgi:hypothetical protein